MSNLLKNEPVCTRTLQHLDLYLDNQLSDEERALLAGHLDLCPACRQEVDLRKRVKDRLRAVVHEQTVSPYLRTRILANVQQDLQKASWFSRQFRVSAATAALVICLAGFAGYQLGYLRVTADSQDRFIAMMSQHVPGLMSVGLREHVHCSVFRKYPANAPTLEQARTRLPESYQPLLPILTAHVPSDFHVAIAHRCGYRDRDVIHIGLRSQSRLLSLIITTKRAGDSFTAENLKPILAAAGAEVYAAGVQGFQITALESREHLAYIVSDLSQEDNNRLMLAVAPRMRAFLDGLHA